MIGGTDLLRVQQNSKVTHSVPGVNMQNVTEQTSSDVTPGH